VPSEVWIWSRRESGTASWPRGECGREDRPCEKDTPVQARRHRAIECRRQGAHVQLVRQYEGYKPFADLGVNGKLTLAENIADLAGVTAAHDAWRASLHGKPAPVIGGLTGEQQFFLAFAQMYRAKFREPALRRVLLTNGHSPGMYRLLTVRNLDAWYDAFGVRPGDALYLAPADRVRPR